jgi:hypothetical protein
MELVFADSHSCRIDRMEVDADIYRRLDGDRMDDRLAGRSIGEIWGFARKP